MGILEKHSIDHPLLQGFAEHLRVNLENTRFLDYNTALTNLRKDDKALYNDCVDFVDYIGSVQSMLSKQVSKEIVSKRHAMLMDKDVLSPRDCWAIFEKAEEGFLNIMNQLGDSSTPPLAASQCIFVLYYLEAIVILKHCQRPCVVENMKVAEWLGRKQEAEHTIIYAAHFAVGIALSKQEEEWFEKYYTRVRPQHLAAKGKRKRDERNDKDGDEFFFVSSTGKKINHPTSDLDRLHEKHNLPHVNSQTVRRTFETEANCLDEPKKALVAGYLAHSVNTAAKHYRLKNRRAVVEGADLLAKMVEASSARPSGEGNSHEPFGEGPIHPSDESSNHEQFSRRMPAKDRVDAWVRKQGWKGMTANIGSAVIDNWAPSGSVDRIMDSKQIQTMVKTQQWKGLYIQDFNERGRGIITTRTFEAGEVVCDYHGTRGGLVIWHTGHRPASGKKLKSLEVEAAKCAKLTDLFGAGFTSPAAAGAPGDERGGLDNDERVEEADMTQETARDPKNE
ncbi:unnamed protein product [Pleuronectes platessa]|uniref:SET domain-containing protein n=1 Tax=Pleuronectes platessa TaxID=8262 RepID=A0A9N7UQU5_PLEPL|nr:unnamed protein product [Pleuronectes platessa]